jgi:hypothetical protein
LAWDEHSGKQWRELRTSEHIVLNQARRPDSLIASNGNERSRNLVMATSAFYSRSAIIDCLCGPEMIPLLMKPVCDRCDELTTISEILDGHECPMFVGDTPERSTRNWLRGLVGDGEVVATKSLQASNRVKPIDSAIEVICAGENNCHSNSS